MIKDDKESLIWEQTVNSIFFRMTLYGFVKVDLYQPEKYSEFKIDVKLPNKQQAIV